MKNILIALAAVVIFSTGALGAKEQKNMNRIELAKQTYEKLFNAKLSPNPTDPELMEILQRFIFGEVFHTGVLDEKQREIITVTILATQQCLPQLKAHVGAALNIGVTPVEIRETLYTLSPIIGFPKVLNAVNAANEVFATRKIKLPLESMANVNDEDRYEKGRKIQAPLYGDRAKNIASELPKNSDFIPTLLTELCFGDFYTRTGLSLKTRELIIFCSLAALGDTSYSMGSHAIGNLKAGNSKEILVAAMIQCAPYMGFPRTLNALKIIKDAKLPENEGNPNLGFDTGGEFKNENFTGRVWLKMLSPRDKEFNCPVALVTFEPSCINAWHSHPGGQILICTYGEGWYQQKGKPAQPLKSGDIVRIPPDTVHWHGAKKDSWFSHLSIETNADKGNAKWLDKVDECDYKKLK